MFRHILIYVTRASTAREALSALATADDADAQANLNELEVDRAVANRELRVQGGDVVKAPRALVNA